MGSVPCAAVTAAIAVGVARGVGVVVEFPCWEGVVASCAAFVSVVTVVVSVVAIVSVVAVAGGAVVSVVVVVAVVVGVSVVSIVAFVSVIVIVASVAAVRTVGAVVVVVAGVVASAVRVRIAACGVLEGSGVAVSAKVTRVVRGGMKCVALLLSVVSMSPSAPLSSVSPSSTVAKSTVVLGVVVPAAVPDCRVIVSRGVFLACEVGRPPKNEARDVCDAVRVAAGRIRLLAGGPLLFVQAAKFTQHVHLRGGVARRQAHPEPRPSPSVAHVDWREQSQQRMRGR